MNTIVIWDTCGMEALKFFIVKNINIDHLDGKYLNSTETADSEADEINELLKYDDCGSPQIKMLDEFPVAELFESCEYTKDDGTIAYDPTEVSIIILGFLP